MSPGIIVIMAGMNLTGFHTLPVYPLPCQSRPCPFSLGDRYQCSPVYFRFYPGHPLVYRIAHRPARYLYPRAV